MGLSLSGSDADKLQLLTQVTPMTQSVSLSYILCVSTELSLLVCRACPLQMLYVSCWTAVHQNCICQIEHRLLRLA